MSIRHSDDDDDDDDYYYDDDLLDYVIESFFSFFFSYSVISDDRSHLLTAYKMTFFGLIDTDKQLS
jgi:hypothetical protein